MTEPRPFPPSADEGLTSVDRGQRVRRETIIGSCHDGKERAYFAMPMRGVLPADMQGTSGGPASVTVEDVVELAPTSSAWEAIEEAE
jgi:hypothetical protein